MLFSPRSVDVMHDLCLVFMSDVIRQRPRFQHLFSVLIIGIFPSGFLCSCNLVCLLKTELKTESLVLVKNTLGS